MWHEGEPDFLKRLYQRNMSLPCVYAFYLSNLLFIYNSLLTGSQSLQETDINARMLLCCDIVLIKNNVHLATKFCLLVFFYPPPHPTQQQISKVRIFEGGIPSCELHCGTFCREKNKLWFFDCSSSLLYLKCESRYK